MFTSRGLSNLLITAVGVMIEKTHTMATDDDIESILTTSDTFFAVPEISFTAPIEDITRAVIEYEESGVPFVVTGFPFVEDDDGSPFRQSKEWMESMYTNRGVSAPGFLPVLSLKSHSSQRCVDRRPQHRRRPQRHR